MGLLEKAAGAAFVVALIFGAGWKSRGVLADNEMYAYKEVQQQGNDKQQTQVDAVVKADTQNTEASTARVDTQEQTRQVEVKYVDREVIKYRDRPVAGKCVLPVEWLQLYNRAGRTPAKLPAPGPT